MLYKQTFSFRVFILISFGALIIIGCGPNTTSAIGASTPPDLVETLVKQPVNIPEFHLTDHKGQLFTNKQLQGKWNFVFFGYTQCPDVCPTTLMELDDLAKLLQKSAQNSEVQYVFVSIDPERDTVKRLAEFIPYFNKTFIALTGDLSEITKLTNSVDIFHNRQKIATESIVDHSSAMVLVNPSNQYYARFEAPHYARDIQAVFVKIREYYNKSHS